jgi:hypothetical protein
VHSLRRGGDEKGVGIRQRHHRECRLHPRTCDLDRCLAKVELRFTRWMAERHEDLGARSSVLCDVAADRDLAAHIAMLVAKALEDPSSRVALLWRRRRIGVIRQDLVDHPGERTEDRPSAFLATPIAGRLWKLEHLVERPPAHSVVTDDRSLRDPLDEHLAPDLCPQLHVGVHPSPVPLANPVRGVSGRVVEGPGMSGAVVFDDHNFVRGAVVFGERSHPDLPRAHRAGWCRPTGA